MYLRSALLKAAGNFHTSRRESSLTSVLYQLLNSVVNFLTYCSDIIKINHPCVYVMTRSALLTFPISSGC